MFLLWILGLLGLAGFNGWLMGYVIVPMNMWYLIPGMIWCIGSGWFYGAVFGKWLLRY